MTRHYQLIRYIPDPVRGESINLGLIAFVDGHALVRALPSDDIRSISVQSRPEVFGLEAPPVASTLPAKLPTFDAVLPNCVRVLALKGLVTSQQLAASSFFDTRMGLRASSSYFASAAPSTNVITGALLLPHATGRVAPAIRDEMGNELAVVVGRIDVPGLEPRPAVFDLSDPADADDLERLARIFAQAA